MTEEKKEEKDKKESAVETKPEQKDEKKEVPKKLQEILSTVEKMTVLELSELVKALEDKFGVSAMMPVSAGTAGPSGGDEETEEKTSFTVHLATIGDKKIQVIKVVREITGLGLKEAKALVDSAPKPVKENIAQDEANKIKEKLTAVGAGVEIK